MRRLCVGQKKIQSMMLNLERVHLLTKESGYRKGERGEIRQRRRKAVFDRVREQMARAAANVPDTSLRVSTQPDNPSQPTLFPPHDPSASEKALRLEIQTKDPNIRIIWFTQREPKPALPNSKGT